MKFCNMCLFFLSFAGIASDNIRLSEPTYADGNIEVFGQMFEYNSQAKPLSFIMQTPESFTHQEMLISTVITKVCQKKGCFFMSQIDDQMIRVSFKDYGFFIPTNSADKKIILKGELIKTTTTPEKAKHYADDLVESEKAVNIGEAYEIIAHSIAIPK